MSQGVSVEIQNALAKVGKGKPTKEKVTHGMALDQIHKTLAAVICILCFLMGCVQAVPPDLLVALEAIDQDLIALRAPEAAPEEYGQFVRQWVSLKARVQLDDDLITWPWESSDLENELRRLYIMGSRTVSQLHERQTSQHRTVQAKVARLEERLHTITSKVESIDGRILLGEKAVRTDLLVKQARSFFERKISNEPCKRQRKRITLSRRKLYYSAKKWGATPTRAGSPIGGTLAKQTIDWSRIHQSTAIVVSKAERELTLYKSGRKGCYHIPSGWGSTACWKNGSKGTERHRKDAIA